MSEEQPRTIRSEIVGNDVDQARQMFEGAYNGDRFAIEPTEARFAYRYTSVGDDELTLRGNLFQGSIRGVVETRGEYVVSWITAGHGSTDLERDAVHLEYGRPAMFVTNRPATFEFADFRQNLMHFDAAFLERVASDHEGADGPLLFDTLARPSDEALRRWAVTVASVARVVYSPDSPELLRSEANRAAAIALLETFPHESLHVVTDAALPPSGTLRSAVDYLHANAHRPLRTEEIAAACGVSLRTLQSAFRRDLGLTPLDYLRRVRLEHVRRELRSASVDTMTVGDVAHRWGFAHLGRFSASYAERFGEHPRDTLRR